MGAYPKETATVFKDRIHFALRDAVMAEEIPEGKIVILSLNIPGEKK
jgi:hypothetical protein